VTFNVHSTGPAFTIRVYALLETMVVFPHYYCDVGHPEFEGDASIVSCSSQEPSAIEMVVHCVHVLGYKLIFQGLIAFFLFPDELEELYEF
jgi:hypothetical protein